MTMLVPAIDWSLGNDPRPEMEWDRGYRVLGRHRCTECAKRGVSEPRADLVCTKHAWGEREPEGHLVARCPAHQAAWVQSPPAWRVGVST